MHNPALVEMRISREEYRQRIQRALEPHRFEILKNKSEWIKRVESRFRSSLASGSEVDPDAVRPSLEIVRTSKQHELWRYCRLLGSIPFNRGCGRLIRYLLRDEGHERRPVMGVIALSSPVLINRPRDEWIGWQYPRDTDIKRRRLLACMELSVSMAVPPYNQLTAGKMICLAVMSNEVRQDYMDKFGAHITPTGLVEGRLSLITTTSLYGSSVQYNRIRVDGRTAYKLIGYTSGFGNAYITERQFGEMEKYLKGKGKDIPKGWGTGRSYRLRVYTAYARLHDGQPMAPSHQHPRSIYLAPLASNTADFLCGRSDTPDFYDLPLSRLIEIWRERWVKPRLARSDIKQRFQSTAVPWLSAQLEAYDEQVHTAAVA